jgi:hypothetical protein
MKSPPMQYRRPEQKVQTPRGDASRAGSGPGGEVERARPWSLVYATKVAYLHCSPSWHRMGASCEDKLRHSELVWPIR